jgi:hypothetical protein
MADEHGREAWRARSLRAPDDWGAADAELKRRIIRDEIRFARDEERIAQEERWIRRNWWLESALGAILALTIAALVISAIALNRDIEAAANAAPRPLPARWPPRVP